MMIIIIKGWYLKNDEIILHVLPQIVPGTYLISDSFYYYYLLLYQGTLLIYFIPLKYIYHVFTLAYLFSSPQ